MLKEPCKITTRDGKPFTCACGRDNMFIKQDTPNPLYHIYKCFVCERVYEAS